MSREDPDTEFHRRRAEIEMEQAMAARRPSEAIAHLELARLHRQRRNALAREHREFCCAPCNVRIDKEA